MLYNISKEDKMGKYMKKKKNTISTIINFIIKIFWIFVIGSIFGFFVEMLYGSLYTRALVIRKGLLYGPFVQIYGIGAIAYYLLIMKTKNPKEAFLGGLIMGGLLEYLCSFFQEIFFGSISWDYSKSFLNFNGRICVLYCIYWGIIALIFLKIVYPWIIKFEHYIYKKRFRIITIFMIIFMTFDITVSCMAANRQKERHRNIPPRNAIDNFIDRTYPDEYVDKVYNNKREIQK